VATKKQVRRREKLRRHEYEEVYVDAEGNVVEPPSEDEPTAGSKPARNGKRQSEGRLAGRGGRTVQPPSWRRVGKRALIFAPLLYVAISLFPGGNDLTVLGRVLTTLWYLALLLPFMYLMDRLTYRLWLRRADRAGAGRKRPSQ
jgi:hypothetical protein